MPLTSRISLWTLLGWLRWGSWYTKRNLCSVKGNLNIFDIFKDAFWPLQAFLGIMSEGKQTNWKSFTKPLLSVYSSDILIPIILWIRDKVRIQIKKKLDCSSVVWFAWIRSVSSFWEGSWQNWILAWQWLKFCFKFWTIVWIGKYGSKSSCRACMINVHSRSDQAPV